MAEVADVRGSAGIQNPSSLRFGAFLLHLRQYESADGFSALVEVYFSNKVGSHAKAQPVFRDIYLKHRVCVLKATYELFTKTSTISSSQDVGISCVGTKTLQRGEPRGISVESYPSDHANSIRLSNSSQRKHLDSFVKQRLYLLRKYNIRRTADVIIDVAFMGLRSRLKLLVDTAVTVSRSHGVHTMRARSVSSPRTSVRQLNSRLEERQNLRCAEERKALILAGETLKRNRVAPDDDEQLKEKVTKVLQEEEDRARAMAANEAARSALGGDAKYLRWSIKDSQIKHTTTEPESKIPVAVLTQPSITAPQKILKRGITLADLFFAMHREAPVRTSTKTRKQQYLAQVKLNTTAN